jgi:hypothetical protein
MKVSRQFLCDFALIANYYEWTAKEVEEVKEQTRGNHELMQYWTQLAAAHRAGYVQNRDNSWQRLGAWQQIEGERRKEPREFDY